MTTYDDCVFEVYSFIKIINSWETVFIVRFCLLSIYFTFLANLYWVFSTFRNAASLSRTPLHISSLHVNWTSSQQYSWFPRFFHTIAHQVIVSHAREGISRRLWGLDNMKVCQKVFNKNLESSCLLRGSGVRTRVVLKEDYAGWELMHCRFWIVRPSLVRLHFSCIRWSNIHWTNEIDSCYFPENSSHLFST